MSSDYTQAQGKGRPLDDQYTRLIEGRARSPMPRLDGDGADPDIGCNNEYQQQRDAEHRYLDAKIDVNTDLIAQDEDTYQPPATTDLIAPSDFQPFFVLVEDPSTGEEHHPTVHYVFSDDDPAFLTNTVLNALDSRFDNASPEAQQQESEERYTVLDLTPDGKNVSSISSLSPNWQALKTTVTPAPSWAGASNRQDSRLLLKISGLETKSLENKPQIGQDVSLKDLVTQFNDSLERFDDVLGAVRGVNGENVEKS